MENLEAANRNISDRILFAQYLRGIACLMVLFFHFFEVFWTYTGVPDLFNYPAYTGPVPTISLLMHSSGFHLGIIGTSLFFLISGFVIPFSLQKKDSIKFLVMRFFRIFPTWVVALTIILTSIAAASWYYIRSFPLDVENIFLNYLLVWDLFRGTDICGGAWTLVIELKFYLICAVAVVLLRNADWKKIILLCLGLVIGMTLLGRPTFEIPILVYMFIGTTLYFYYMDRISLKETIISASALLALFIISGVGKIPLLESLTLTNSYFIGLGIFLICFSISKFNIGALSNPGIITSAIYLHVERLLTFFADISYPLYLIHGTLNYVMMRILLDWGVSPFVVIAIAIVDSITLAWLLHILVELPTNDYGKRVADAIPINFTSMKSAIASSICLPRK